MTLDPALRSMLAEQLSASGGHNEPLITALLSSLLQQQPAAEPSEGDDLHDRFRRAKHIIRQQREALRSADRMVEYVGRLFGACQCCWGLDHDCRRCAGQGGPGTTMPDVTELLRWIEPALLRTGFEVTSRGAARPHHSEEGA